MKNTIAFVAGHSGGHTIPCITQAKKELELNNEIIFFCTDSALDKKILNNADFIKNKFFLPNITLSKKVHFISNLNKIFIKSFITLFKYKPTKIVSMGGLVSVPVCLAAKILGIKIELWELNVEPGKAVKFISKLTPEINICFKETQKHFPNKKINIVNYPVRFSKTLAPKNIPEFSNDKKTIFIIGGSQGSVFINSLIKDIVNLNTEFNNDIQIIHQVGADTFDWQGFYNALNIPAITFAFYDKVEEYYQFCDIVICRSGAGTLAEVLFFNKKCITIPLETKTTDHQILNAHAMMHEHPELFFVLKQNDIIKNKDIFFTLLKAVY